MRKSKHSRVRRAAIHGDLSQATALERTFYTLVPSLAFAERCCDIAKFGEIPEELWVDCVVSSKADDSLATPGKHILTCFVQYVPYHLQEGNWYEKNYWAIAS
ncbi:MAG TPA: hypothetical protein VIX37_01395 [Candidatus Sulfotelmatobacter sp.]